MPGYSTGFYNMNIIDKTTQLQLSEQEFTDIMKAIYAAMGTFDKSTRGSDVALAGRLEPIYEAMQKHNSNR